MFHVESSIVFLELKYCFPSVIDDNIFALVCYVDKYEESMFRKGTTTNGINLTVSKIMFAK
uniref:Uncharacterized protein n=1 Tax=Arundo donax TaxID=35708 RepID=A0A0A9CJP3_ARUDO